MLSSSSPSPALSPPAFFPFPYTGPSNPATRIPADHLSIHGFRRLLRHGRRPKFPNGRSNADCARFRLRQKKGDPDMQLQKELARTLGVQRRLEVSLVSSVKRIAVTSSRIRQCRQLHLDPSPFLRLRESLYLENRMLRLARSQSRIVRWTFARMLALVEMNKSRILALSSCYRSIILPSSLIRFPSSHPTSPAISLPSISSDHPPFTLSTHRAHWVDLKRTWDTAFGLASPDPSFRTLVDFDGTAQHAAVGSHLSDHGIGMMPSKRRRI